MHIAKADPSMLQSARQTDGTNRFNQTLLATIDALEAAKIDYALIGGVASHGLGRPRTTHDIDVFVRPEDAVTSLDALSKSGFKIEKTDPTWLFKAFKNDILVDIIFKSRGEIYFDSEMSRRAKLVEYHGRRVRAVAPEDLIIIKCVVHDEIGPHHWHDALALLSNASLDWDYLLKRARRAPRRLLSLLFYAQSIDIWVPDRVIHELYKTVFGETGQMHYRRNPQPAAAPSDLRKHADAYVIANVKSALASDTRTGEQDVTVVLERDRGGERLVLRGEVVSEERRRLIEAVVREAVPSIRLENQLRVQIITPPDEAEDVR
jgi:hypothetical protein